MSFIADISAIGTVLVAVGFSLWMLKPCLSGCHRHLPDVVFRDFTE